MTLDAITIADDDTYISRLQAQRNLPNQVKTGLNSFA